MRTYFLAPTILTAAIALLTPAFAWSQTIANVNGKVVTKADVDHLLSAALPADQKITPELEKRAQSEAVVREILLQEARRKGVENEATFKADLQQARDATMIKSLMRDYQQQHPVTDAELAAGYEDVKKSLQGPQYHARHIVLKTEDEAKAVIVRLKGGASFEQVAAEVSVDPQTAKNGGDLGWLRASGLVPDVRDALLKLKKGEITAAPVKSTFGYHVIKLEDTREGQVPTLEAVKPELQRRLSEIKLVAYRQSLIKAAKTDFKFGE